MTVSCQCTCKMVTRNYECSRVLTSFNKLSGNWVLKEEASLTFKRTLERRRGMGVNLRGMKNFEVLFYIVVKKGGFQATVETLVITKTRKQVCK